MRHTFADLRPRTRWLRRLLYLLAVFDVLSFIGNAYERKVLQKIAGHGFDSDDAMQAAAALSDQLQRLTAIPELCLLLAVYVLSGMWIYRAASNARAASTTPMRSSPGWSVGWYFIPFANLIKPFQAMDDIWRASQHPSRWTSIETPALLRLWWALWLINGALGNVVARASFSAESMEQLLHANVLQSASDVISLPLNLVFAYIVMRIGSMQATQALPEIAFPQMTVE